MVLQGGFGIPKFHWCGIQGGYFVLIMELLGKSTEDLFNYCNRKFSLLTTLMLIDQMISCIEYIHSQYFIHRDVKPNNFLMGRNLKKSQVYIIDFGISKRYYDPNTGLHIPYKDGKGLTGTARYASINTHFGIEQSRRDDIEALGYILVYFMKGSLPWQGLKAKTTEEKYQKIKEKKISISLGELCRGLPDEFKTFIQYARDLNFEDKPDYSYLKNIIRKISEKNQLTFNYNKYDWILNKEESNNEEKKERNVENDKQRTYDDSRELQLLETEERQRSYRDFGENESLPIFEGFEGKSSLQDLPQFSMDDESKRPNLLLSKTIISRLAKFQTDKVRNYYLLREERRERIEKIDRIAQETLKKLSRESYAFSIPEAKRRIMAAGVLEAITPEEAKAAMERAELVKLGQIEREGEKSKDIYVTTKENIDIEKAVIERVKSGKESIKDKVLSMEESRAALDRAEARAKAQGLKSAEFTITDRNGGSGEQAAAVHHVLVSNDKFLPKSKRLVSLWRTK